MTFEEWLTESLYRDTVTPRTETVSTSRGEIAAIMEAAWQAGMYEGYKQGYAVARMTEVSAPPPPKDNR